MRLARDRRSRVRIDERVYEAPGEVNRSRKTVLRLRAIFLQAARRNANIHERRGDGSKETIMDFAD